MSVLTCTVTAGYTFVKDALNRSLLTRARLNQLGTPTVQVNLAGSVAGVDLASALANMLITGTATVGSESSNNIDVTLQLVNAGNSPIAAVTLVRVWLANSATGGPDVSTFPAGGVSVTTGTQITANADNVIGVYLTDANGVLTLRYTHATGALSGLFYIAELQNRLIQGSQSLVWS